MPFSPQPRKKGVPAAPQGGDKPSCGHSGAAVKGCAECAKRRPKLVDAAVEKQKIMSLVEKVGHVLTTDPKGAEKAAFILSRWISRKR